MKLSSNGEGFRAINPVTGEALEPEYFDARLRDIDAALAQAAVVAPQLSRYPGAKIQDLLDAIAVALESQREEVIARCRLETGYPLERVAGEFKRMVDGMRLFGEVAECGDWLNVRIDHAQPEREPMPKPDLRCMQVPVGPVVVFGASNFPLALSVAGSDVASALAAGCPVVVKGHPSHPGTSELLAKGILEGVGAAGFPPGTFAMVQGASNIIGQALVEHPKVAAVAFTGSLKGGRAIFDLAAKREVPVPVYAEMGSVNPQFVLPDLLEKDPGGFAKQLFAAATLGNGQFCTNPGLGVCGWRCVFPAGRLLHGNERLRWRADVEQRDSPELPRGDRGLACRARSRDYRGWRGGERCGGRHRWCGGAHRLGRLPPGGTCFPRRSVRAGHGGDRVRIAGENGGG